MHSSAGEGQSRGPEGENGVFEQTVCELILMGLHIKPGLLYESVNSENAKLINSYGTVKSLRSAR